MHVLSVNRLNHGLRVSVYYLLLAALLFTILMPLIEAYALRAELLADGRRLWAFFAKNFLLFALLFEALILLALERRALHMSLLRIFIYKPTRETDLYFWMYFTAVYYYLPLSIAKSPTLSSIFPVFDLGAFGGEIIAFFFLSFTAYAIHWLSHNVPALWELHKMHHSATELTCITGPREHLLFEMIHIGIFVLFFDTQNMLVSFAFASRAFLNVLQHSHLNLKLGWLGQMVISPHAHRLHHLKNPAYFNKNFSSDITLWDRLFGTFAYEAPLSAEQMEADFGLDLKENPGGEKFVLSELLTTTVRSLKVLWPQVTFRGLKNYKALQPESDHLPD